MKVLPQIGSRLTASTGVVVALACAFVLLRPATSLQRARQTPSQIDMSQKWRTAYYVPPESRVLPISAVPFSKYSHVILYAILPVYDADTDSCTLDLTRYRVSARAAEFINTAHDAGSRALVSMLHDNTAAAIRTCTDPSHVVRFAVTISTFIRDYGFDGFDVDWEMGVVNSQYEQWLTSLRDAMPERLLTVAASWNQRYVLARIQDKIDQINVAAYDADVSTVRGRWRTDTAYNVALYQSSDQDWVTADSVVYYMTRDAGIKPGKLGIGLPFYARIKRGCQAGYLDAGNCAKPITGPGQVYASGNALVNPRPSIEYRDLINSQYWALGQRVWDAPHGAQYISYTPDNNDNAAFVSYTGVEQIQEAVRYIKSAGLGGIMMYQLAGEYLDSQDGDDRYPLSSAMYGAWTESAAPPAQH